jgi:hypothetical protein
MLEGPHSREEADCICARVGCLARHELDEIVFVKRQVGVDELVELDRADAHWILHIVTTTRCRPDAEGGLRPACEVELFDFLAEDVTMEVNKLEGAVAV